MEKWLGGRDSTGVFLKMGQKGKRQGKSCIVPLKVMLLDWRDGPVGQMLAFQGW